MYITQTDILRKLTKEQYNCLKLMCQYSNNLYNVALYNIRQYYFQEEKFLTYENNYHLCKENENYKLLQAGVAQQTLKLADRSFKSFFNLIKKAKKGEYRFQNIELPKYKEKGGLFPLILSLNAITITKGYLKIPMSNTFTKENKCKMKIKLPKRLEGKKIKEIRILPLYKGTAFKIQYVYLQEEEPKELDINNSLAIDFGVSNLATCVDNKGNSFIIDGKYLKSVNQFYNKCKAHLQSINDKQKNKSSKRLYNLTMKRNNKCKDYMNKACRYIVNYCIKNNIGTIICGYNTGFKDNVNNGKINNQNFTQISYGNIRGQLKYLCERYGIKYIEQEESYTSKASFMDLDYLPVYNPNTEFKGKFSGKRVKRGLYKTKEKKLVNADVNGACNILRKSKQNFNFEELCRGLVNSPKRIRLLQTSLEALSFREG